MLLKSTNLVGIETGVIDVKISTRGSYGLRAMVELAMHEGIGPMPLRVIADRQDVSESYLEQLMAALRKAGLVNSVRGHMGGYELALPPEEIVVGDIIRILEGPISPIDCIGDNAVACEREEQCVTKFLWQKLKDSIEDVLDSTTLQDLCDKASHEG